MNIWIFHRDFTIAIGAIALAVMGFVSCYSREPQKPNIFLFYVDDLDFDEISPFAAHFWFNNLNQERHTY